MIRLINRLLATPKLHELINKRNGRDTVSLLFDADILAIDNVANYYHEAAMNAVGGIHWAFPNVAPPFDNFFMEFYYPGKKGRLIHGAHFLAVETNKLDSGITSTIPTAKDSKWVVSCMPYGYDNDLIGMIPFLVRYAVNEDGGFSKDSDGSAFFYHQYEDKKDFNFERLLYFWLYPMFLATSFLHCKNVTLQTETPPSSVSLKYEKKHGVPLASYKTLNIEPMKTILRTEGNSEKTGLKQALHICRGYFKDYSKGGGLFGKYKGLYWWDSTVRGSVSEGIIDKDYAVKSPKQ